MKIVVATAAAIVALAIIVAVAFCRSAASDRDLWRGLLLAESASRKPQPIVPVSDAEKETLRLRIDALEVEVSDLRRKNAELERKPATPPVPPAPARLDPNDTPKFQAVVLDSTKSEAARVDALLNLRMTPDGRTEEVVRSMLQLLGTSQDPRVRADVCRHLKRAVPITLAAPLLLAMASDADARVREEAAETLGPLKADPSVSAALRHAAANDPSDKVRMQAGKSLAE